MKIKTEKDLKYLTYCVIYLEHMNVSLIVLSYRKKEKLYSMIFTTF